MDLWLREMGNLGIATYAVDSFAGTGIFSTTLDQDQLGQLAEIYDAYRALEDVAKHPRIDPNRIAVMGFSRGGQAALYASLKRFQRRHGPSGLEFAAYIPLYAICNIGFINDTDVSDKPI
jgi:dienelactone hydrolase